MTYLTFRAPRASRVTRALVAVLTLATALAPLPAEAFLPQQPSAPRRTEPAAQSRPPAPPQVRVNRTVPKVERPPLRPAFSRVPTDREIRRAPMFSLPLVPMGESSDRENQALGQALTRFADRGNRTDWRALDDYLTGHPTSPWRPALVANLADCGFRKF